MRFDTVEVSTTPQFTQFDEEVIRLFASRGPGVRHLPTGRQDILQGLDESNVVIADVTPANPNVFYELGYSQL